MRAGWRFCGVLGWIFSAVRWGRVERQTSSRRSSLAAALYVPVISADRRQRALSLARRGSVRRRRYAVTRAGNASRRKDPRRARQPAPPASYGGKQPLAIRVGGPLDRGGDPPYRSSCCRSSVDDGDLRKIIGQVGCIRPGTSAPTATSTDLRRRTPGGRAVTEVPSSSWRPPRASPRMDSPERNLRHPRAGCPTR
jgi:hypothetical protein